MQYAKRGMEQDLVHVFPNILAILTRSANQSALKILIVNVQKLASTKNVKILVQVFVVSIQFATLLTIHLNVSAYKAIQEILLLVVELHLKVIF
jgi:hypothetical protein